MASTQEPAGTATETLSEAAKLGTKMMRGAKLLNEMRDSDVQIATTPKDEVWHLDKVTLYHYPAHGREARPDAGADRLRADRPLDHGRSAG